MRILRYILIFNLILTLIPLRGQEKIDGKISDEVEILADSIAYENVLMNSAIGFAAIKPDQYKRFEQLSGIVTIPELLALTNHKNGVVRCYAFWDLASKDTTSIFEIVKNHLEDNEIVETQFGCIGEAQRVGDLFLNVVTPDYVDNSVHKLSSDQRKEIDSLLLNSENKRLYAKYDLLVRIEPSENNYERIREIALKEKTPQAYLALAKYQKQQDINIIEELLINKETEYWGFRCIQYFPDTIFYKYLVDWHTNNFSIKKPLDDPKIRAFYKALVQYKTEQSKDMMLQSIRDTKGFAKKVHNKYVMIALLKYPTLYFDEVRLYLKVDRLDLEEIIWDKTEIDID